MAQELAGRREADAATAGSADRPATAAPEAGLLGPHSDERPVLSVVMPTLDEAEGVGRCIEAVRATLLELGITGEVIVADSSSDRTAEIAREHGAIVVEPDELGYGYAYRYAFRFARGEYLAMGDADGTYDFRELPRLFAHAENGADLVLGSRLAGDIEPGAMPTLHRYVGNPLLTWFLNAFYDAGVSDAHSGLRVFHRSTLDRLDLEADGMEFASEMVMDAAVKGLTIVEEPITYRERLGEPKLDSLRDGWRHVKFMLLNVPTYLFSVPALALGAVGVVVMLASVLGAEVAGVTFGTHTVIAGSLLAIVGYQVGSLAVFSRVASDPIREPDDRVTAWIVESISLEQGATAGLVLFAVGAAYVGAMAVRWVSSGYTALPFLNWNMVAFTAIVLGVQTVFYTFFLSMLTRSTDGTPIAADGGVADAGPREE